MTRDDLARLIYTFLPFRPTKPSQKTLDDWLIKACKLGEIASCRRLLKAGADVGVNGDFPVQIVAIRSDAALVEILLQHGASPRALQSQLNFSLRLAAARGLTVEVDARLNAGADVHADGDDALIMAASNGHLDTVNLLIQRGAHVRAKEDYALHLAILGGHAGVACSLIRAGSPLAMIFFITAGHDDDVLIATLNLVHPDVSPQKITEELTMMEALGLNPAQMAEIWQGNHAVYQPDAHTTSLDLEQ